MREKQIMNFYYQCFEKHILRKNNHRIENFSTNVKWNKINIQT